MKSVILRLTALGTLASCTTNVLGVSNRSAETPAAAWEKALGSQREPLGYSSARVSEENYEIKYSGAWPASRDALEGGLLHHAATVAKEHGSNWFRFLHMPGEGGPRSHASRPSPAFGAAYGHWQPHWSYLTSDGWQPWHPEWGDRFWAERAGFSSTTRVELHAMIELRPGAAARGETTDFEVSAVLRDLRRYKSVKRY